MLISWAFAAFVAVTFVVYWWLTPARFRSWLLPAAGFLFFFWYYPREMLFLLGLTIVVYLLGRLSRRFPSAGRGVTVIGVLLLVADLLFFKYSGLLTTTINRILPAGARLPVSSLARFAPLGISYFTFKMIHYLVDQRKGTIPSHRAVDFLNYIFFFPILTAGPIERFQPFLSQSLHPRSFDSAVLSNGMPRILLGTFKKVVLAELFGIAAGYLQKKGCGAGMYWIASLAYTMQIYFDFSGYSDIAVGVSRLFGYDVMENFNLPYLARNLSQFWKRWHISLTRWFTDYIFIPLGGSRVAFGRILLNTLVVMIITGLWHGAAWHFVIWGLFHAGGMIVWRLFHHFVLPYLEARFQISRWRLGALLSTCLTFLFVDIGWIFFACSWTQAQYVLSVMFGG